MLVSLYQPEPVGLHVDVDEGRIRCRLGAVTLMMTPADAALLARRLEDALQRVRESRIPSTLDLR